MSSARVDIATARAESAAALELWLYVRHHPDSPPFGGGVYSDWPAWAAEALSIMNAEDACVRALVMHEEMEAIRG